MAGTTIGRVDFLVDFNGRDLPRQARAIGREVGTQMGRSAGERFDVEMAGVADRLRARLRSAARENGETFGTTFGTELRARLRAQEDDFSRTLAGLFADRGAFNDFVSESNSVTEGLERIEAGLQRLRNENRITWNEFQSASKTVREWGADLRSAEADVERHRNALVDLHLELDRMQTNVSRVDEAFDRFNNTVRETDNDMLDLSLGFDKVTRSSDRSTKSVDEQGSAWKRLSFNLRQAIVIVAAVAAAGEQISTLGSAAGAGLALLGTSAISAGTGLGVLVAGLQGVSDKLELFAEQKELANQTELSEEDAARLAELNEELAKLDPAYASIVRLGEGFKLLQDNIEAALLSGMGPAIDDLTNRLLPGLNAGLVGVADALRNSIGVELADLTSNPGLAKLEEFFANVQRQVPFLVGAVGNLASAIVGFFNAAGPATTRFLAGLERLTSQFDKWVNSAEGQNSINEWLQNGMRILDELGELLGEIGMQFANLVDEDSIQRTIDLIDNLTESMEFVFNILDVLGELDPFGIIAQGLNDTGNALNPVLDALRPLAGIINTLATTHLSMLSIAFEGLKLALIPLQVIFEAVNYVLQRLQEYFEPYVTALQEMTDVTDNLGTEIFEGLKPGLDELLDAFLSLLPSPEELARIIREDVIPWIQNLVSWIVNEVVPRLSDFLAATGEVIDGLGGFEGIQKRLEGFFKFLDSSLALAAAAFSLFRGDIDGVIRSLDRLAQINTPRIIGGGGGRAALPTAVGGIFASSSYRQIGEAGPEAVVPLNRALNQVDPSVRALSAIAQGKSVPITTASGTSITVAPGAISVVGVRNSGQAASAMLDRFVTLAGV